MIAVIDYGMLESFVKLAKKNLTEDHADDADGCSLWLKPHNPRSITQ